MKLKTSIFIGLLTLSVMPAAFAGWADLAGKALGATAGKKMDTTDVVVAMTGEPIMVKYVTSLALINVAQIQLSEAFGLHEQAAQLKAQRKFLEGGAVPSKKQIKKAVKNGAEINATIEANLAEGKELSADSKRKIALGTAAYLGGIYQLAGTVKEIAGLKGDIMGNPLAAAKKIRSLAFIAKTGKSYLGGLKDTSITLGKYAKANGIRIPRRSASIADALPDDI